MLKLFNDDKWRLFRFTVRISIIAIICYTSIQITWFTAIFIFIFLSTYYIPNRHSSYQPSSFYNSRPKLLSLKSESSFSACLDLLPKEKRYDHLKRLAEFLLSEDPTHAESLHHFDPLRANSECLFSRKSRLWGSGKWNSDLSIRENVLILLPLFFLFSEMCKDLHLDGFVLALPSESLASSYETFRSTVLSILTHIAVNDPDGLNCMGSSGTFINQRNWKFVFNNISYFISGFAPFYPDNHCRYSFEVKDFAFLLFQPTTSFDRHNLSENHLDTNFDSPRDVRDQIRKAYRDANRPYKTNFGKDYIPFDDIVKPIE